MTAGILYFHEIVFSGLYTVNGQAFASIIDHAFWQSWWAYGTFLFLILALIVKIKYNEHCTLQTRLKSKRLEAIERSRIKLFANITQQLRNPLTIILGTTKELKDRPAEAANLIESNGYEILSMVNQMIDLSKMESENVKLKFIRTNIIPFLRYLIESMEHVAESKHIQLSFYTEIDKLDMDFDEEKLGHIVTNLLSNAIKLTPDNGKIIFHVNSRLHDQKEALII